MAKRRYLVLTEREGKRLPGVDTKGWTFVVLVGLLLAAIALLDRGSLDTARADGSTGCRLEVTTDQLNVRAGPSAETELVTTYPRGQILDGTTTVTDGFRELEDGRFVADQFLTPVPGGNCG